MPDLFDTFHPVFNSFVLFVSSRSGPVTARQGGRKVRIIGAVLRRVKPVLVIIFFVGNKYFDCLHDIVATLVQLARKKQDEKQSSLFPCWSFLLQENACLFSLN